MCNGTLGAYQRVEFCTARFSCESRDHMYIICYIDKIKKPTRCMSLRPHVEINVNKSEEY